MVVEDEEGEEVVVVVDLIMSSRVTSALVNLH